MRFDDRPVAAIDMAGGQGGTVPSLLLTEIFRPAALRVATLCRTAGRPLVWLVSFFSSYKRPPDWAPSRAGRPLLAWSLSVANAPAADSTNGAARASE